MKKQVVRIAILGIALVAGTAFAQSGRVTANVPFDFYAGNTLMPQGAYEVGGSGGATNALTSIRAEEGKNRILLITNPLSKVNAEPAKLVFHRYGEEYFLAQVWHGENQGRAVPRGSREKELASTGAKPAMAVVTGLRH